MGIHQSEENKWQITGGESELICVGYNTPSGIPGLIAYRTARLSGTGNLAVRLIPNEEYHSIEEGESSQSAAFRAHRELFISLWPNKPEYWPESIQTREEEIRQRIAQRKSTARWILNEKPIDHEMIDWTQEQVSKDEAELEHLTPENYRE
jgi:hypothetical protein